MNSVAPNRPARRDSAESMSKKLILVLVIGFVLCKYNLAQAGVVINEVMYAPASGDSEWIEIFNSGNDFVDLSDWRFFNNKDDSAPLRLQKGSVVLPAGGYAIITTTSDWSSFSGVVFSSSLFSLPNDSSKYSTYKAISGPNKENINSVTYITSPETTGTGNSLQLIGGEWKSSPRTPGLQNPVPNNSSPFTTNNSESVGLVNDTSSTTTTTKTQITEEPKIKTQIMAKTLGFVGLPLSFQGGAMGYQGEQLHFGKYFWNFGDGDSKTVNASDNPQFIHAYFYPGDYVVTLDYFESNYSDIPDASSQFTVKIVPTDMLISGVGDENDFFVKIKNNTDYGADISGWILASDTKSFALPRNTILGAKKEMIISPRISNFSIKDKNTLKLLTPDREVAFDYSASLAPVSPAIIEQVSTKVSRRPTSATVTALIDPETQIAENDLVASAISGDTTNETGNGNFPVILISAMILIGLSAYGVYFIRQKRVVSQVETDFEILDE